VNVHDIAMKNYLKHDPELDSLTPRSD